MRSRLASLSLVVILAGAVAAQESELFRKMESVKPPFPDVVMCAKRVQPVVAVGNTISQRAIYESLVPNKPRLCGSIDLQFSVGAKKATKTRRQSMWYRPTEIRGYFAWQGIPPCRTRPCSERREVYLDDDKVVTFTGDCDANAVLKSIESADLRSIWLYIDGLKKN